jgi:hypothetical protein
MFTGDRIEFKLWSAHSASKMTAMRLGWEGPITPYDFSALNGRLFIAGTADTTLDVQYYNWYQTTAQQLATPIAPKADSVGILFRVNMSRLTNAGLFDPAIHGPVTVRGDSMSSAGTLSWTTGKVVLQRETLSVATGSFWSGVGYFPKSLWASSAPIVYRFNVDNGSFPGIESNIAHRSFVVPFVDSTLTWVWFNDGQVPTGIENEDTPIPQNVHLYQNYPNPFNSETVITYSVPSTGNWVNVSVCDVLGRQVASLVDGPQSDGTHAVVWNAFGMSSGLYTIVLSTSNGDRLVRRSLLIR